MISGHLRGPRAHRGWYVHQSDGLSGQQSDARVDLAAVLGPPMTDSAVRASFLADPGAYLAAIGLLIPSWLNIVAIESEAPSLTIALAPLIDEGAIAEIFLDSANGGGSVLPPWL